MKSVYQKRIIWAVVIVSLCIAPSYHANADPFPFESFKDCNPARRVEPEGEGVLYSVSFNLIRGSIDETYAALEGYGVGEKQWPSTPEREDYIFSGWYDNPEYLGDPYSMDTPIYSDTQLYVKWDYVGSGGCWPRDRRGEIVGINNGDVVPINETISLKVDGYNMHLGAPKDQRFRWKPVFWRISDLAEGNISPEQPFQFEFTLLVDGSYELLVVYEEEVYDGVAWQPSGQKHEVVELSFRAINDSVKVYSGY